MEVKSPATAESYVASVWLWENFLRDEKITDLENAHPGILDDFARWLVNVRGVAPLTAKVRITGVKSWFGHLRRGGVKIPQFEKPELPRSWPKDPVVLTFDQLEKYFDEANALHDPIRTVLILLPLCGLRSREIARLKFTDIKIVDGWVVFTFVGKGKKPRQVPLLRQGNPVLRAYLNGFRAQHKSATPNDWLFPGHAGGSHIATRTIRKWVDDFESRLGFEISPHVLRKTYSTMLDSMNVSPFMIAQLLGHSNIRTTKAHYVKHDTGALVNALAKVHVPGLLKTGT